jgi:hypothetical protein
VVKANIFLTTMENFKTMNEAWDEFFPADLDPKPVFTISLHGSEGVFQGTDPIAGSYMCCCLPIAPGWRCGDRMYGVLRQCCETVDTAQLIESGQWPRFQSTHAIKDSQ